MTMTTRKTLRKWPFYAHALLAGALALTASQAAVAQTRTGGNGTGGFRGYEAVNAALKTRLIDQSTVAGAGFNLSTYLGDDSGSLSRLLGGFDGGEFRNAVPNSLNMLLWYIGLSSFADDLAKAVCEEHSPKLPGGRIALTPGAFAALAPVCALAGDADARRPALQTLWLATVSYDAPHAEFEEWFAGLGAPEATAGLSGRTVLANLLTGALLDPYVLLEP